MEKKWVSHLWRNLGVVQLEGRLDKDQFLHPTDRTCEGYIPKACWHDTREEALRRALRLAKNCRDSLKKQCATVERQMEEMKAELNVKEYVVGRDICVGKSLMGLQLAVNEMMKGEARIIIPCVEMSQEELEAKLKSALGLKK